MLRDSLTRAFHQQSLLQVWLRGFAFLLTLLLSHTAHADLIALWQGNGNALDATGNGHNGALFNGASYGTGVSGQAFRFDGLNDYVEIPGSPALQPSTISIAMWINAAPSNQLRLVADASHGGSGAVNQGGWALQLNSSNKLDFVYGNGSVFPSVVSNSVVADNSFHHVVAILDGTSMQMYVNGSLEATSVYTGTPTMSTANSGNIRLGNHYQFSRPLNGLLDDVRIYNHALSLTQISGLAAIPEPSAVLTFACAASILVFRRKRPA